MKKVYRVEPDAPKPWSWGTTHFVETDHADDAAVQAVEYWCDLEHFDDRSPSHVDVIVKDEGDPYSERYRVTLVWLPDFRAHRIETKESPA